MKEISRIAFVLLPLLCGCTNAANPNPPDPEPAEVTPFSDPPDWAGKVIWYQIFVERFRNGDPDNDPTRQDIEGAYPGFVPENWAITPWTQDWYREDPYMAEAEKGKDFKGNPVRSFGQKAQLRRYGGDLQGVMDKLDYLDSLGVTAIYFNPLNDAPSLHKYDARYWRHIDRNFGPDPKADLEVIAQESNDDPATWQFTTADQMFLEVIEALHSRGMKVILDYSWNHTGNTFWAWKDLLEKQRESKYADWFWVEQFDDPATTADEFVFHGWAGTSTLPEIRETAFIDHSDGLEPAEGNILRDEAKQHIFNVTRRWLDPNGDGDPTDGVDGYRLDVAAEVPLGFWREYRKVVREVNPDAFLLGEIWWEKWPDRLMDPNPFVEGDVFDAPMNYRWYRAVRHFFNASPAPIKVSDFVDSLNFFRSNLREVSNLAMMNLTASHDVPRVATSLFNKNQYKYHSGPGGNPSYKIHKPDAATYETLKLLLVQQFTYIGAPHIWAGDEMGMWGADDPSTRKPLIWPDYEFEPETTHPLGQSRPADEVRFDDELFQYYRNLIRIRKDHAVLVNGDIDFVLVDDEKEVLAYSRQDDTAEAVVVFNTAASEQTISVPVKEEGAYTDVLNEIPLSKAEAGKLAIELPGRSAAILVNVR